MYTCRMCERDFGSLALFDRHMTTVIHSEEVGDATVTCSEPPGAVQDPKGVWRGPSMPDHALTARRKAGNGNLTGTRIGLSPFGREIHVLTTNTTVDDSGTTHELITLCSRQGADELDLVEDPLEHVSCEKCKMILRGQR